MHTLHRQRDAIETNMHLSGQGDRSAAMNGTDGLMGADQRLEIEVVAGGQCLDAVFEKLVEGIRAVEAQECPCLGERSRPSSSGI